MTHEPVAFTVAWLRSVLSEQLVPTVTSMLDPRDSLPAIIVQNVTGGTVVDSSGMDTVYDWTLTVYCHAGKTGPGRDLPDTQAAHQVVAAIVSACRANVTGRFVFDGVQLVDATMVTMTRGVDENGNARAVMTMDLRVKE